MDKVRTLRNQMKGDLHEKVEELREKFIAGRKRSGNCRVRFVDRDRCWCAGDFWTGIEAKADRQMANHFGSDGSNPVIGKKSHDR